MTSPNFFVTSPKKVGRSQKANILLPKKLGEVCKSEMTSPKTIGRSQKQTRNHRKVGRCMWHGDKLSLGKKKDRRWPRTFRLKLEDVKKVGRCPKSLGEACKLDTYFSQLFPDISQKCWEKSKQKHASPNKVGRSMSKKNLVHFLSLEKKGLLPNSYDFSQLFPDISQKSWEKSK